MGVGISTGEATFVGRRRELAALSRLMALAAGGEGRIAMLFGEPGIGKTRLVREVAARARANGSIVCFGTCYEREARPPYAPWVEILAQYAGTFAAGSLLRGEEARESAAVVAAVVPELEWAVDSKPKRLSSQEERIRFFEAVVRLLNASARPLVIVLDDLQWADPPAVDLLEYVAHSIEGTRVFVLATHRDVELEPQHRLSECLGELDRQRRYEPIRLLPLTLEETAALAEQLANRSVSPPAAAAIHAEAAGNPFFIEEVMREVASRGFDLASESPMPPMPWPISPTIRRAVSQRLARLSDDANRVLSVASALSGPFSFEVLQAATELDDETMLDCLDEVLVAGILRPAADADNAYEFSHSLLRQTLYEELSPSRRARLHRRVAQALERAYVGRESETAAELASQFHRSRSLPGAEQGVSFALLAAERAGTRYAHAEAVTYLRMARDLAASVGAAQRAEVLCKLALAEVEALMVDASIVTMEEALATLAEAEARPDAVVDFLCLAVWSLTDAGGPHEAVTSLVERGLVSTLGTQDLAWARLKLAERPVELLAAGPLRAGRWLGFDPKAVRIARESGDETDYARTIELMDWRSRGDTRELYRLVQTWSDPTVTIHGLSVVVRELVAKHGAFVEAEEVCARLMELGERVGSVAARSFGLLYLSHVQAARGDLAAARESISRAGKAIDRLGSGHRLKVHRSFVEFILGQYLDADLARFARIESERAFDPRTPPWLTLLHASAAAYANARSGDAAAARRYLSWIVPPLGTLDSRTINQGASVFFAGAAAWELGEAEDAGELGRLAVDLIASEVCDHAPVSSELTAARMAALLGDVEEARSFFEHARGVLDRRGTRPLRAIVDYDEAIVLRPRDPGAAAVLLESARAEFAALGMKGWLDRADALLRPLRGGRPGGLTPREAEVLRLLAGGRTNKEIAAELVISVHTVERHLATIYRKIGARNRSDATAFAHTSGLATT